MCAHALTVVAVTGAFAQSPPAAPIDSAARWVHESWTVENGLPVNAINQLIQSRSGYIWAATFDGLVRFDGIRFTVFKSATSDGLPSNRIVWVREARDGTLWLFTEQRHLVHYRNGRFVHVDKDRGLGDEQIETVLEDSSGAVWVATTQGVGVIRDDRFVRVARETISAYARSLVQRHDGSVWVGTERQGIFRIGPDHRATRVAADSALDSDIIGRLYEDPDGTLWIGANRGLWRWRERPTRVSLPGLDRTQPFLVLDMLRSSATSALYVHASQGLYRIDSTSVTLVDAFGQFLAGTRLWTDGRAVWHASGSSVLRDGRETFALAPPEPTTGGLLPPYTITTALVDREGSLWLGTQAAGLHRLKPALFTAYSAPEGVADQNVYPTYVDRSGLVWVGTAGKGLSRIDPTTGRVESFEAPRVTPRVNSFFETKPGEIWVGGRSFVSACATATMICRYAGPPGHEQRTVFALHGDASGGIWAASGIGLFRFDRDGWTRFDSSAGAPRVQVRAFVNTRDGAVWMGTNGGGVFRYRDRRFTAITSANGLPSNLVRSLYEDADGWLWIGTEGRGLARLDPRAWDSAGGTRRIVRIGTRDGLFDEVIHQILEDGSGRLWMSTNRGIFWVERRQLNDFAAGRLTRLRSTAYTERDGLRNREANGGSQPAAMKSRDGRLWFATQDGVAVVDPTRIQVNRVPPNVVIEQVTAGGTALRAGDTPMTLSTAQRDLEIAYTALSFLSPANMRFRYRLEPYDTAWVDAGARRTAFYTRVPPGRYTFRVVASNNDDVWNEQGTALELSLAPHLWERGVFRVLAFLMVVVLAVAAVAWRIANLGARARMLTRLVDERTRELRANEAHLSARNAQLAELHESRSRLFANLSHEFRTPLTLILGPLRSVLGGRHGELSPGLREQGELMQRNGRRLLRLINQVLDLAKLQSGALAIERRPHDLVAFARTATLAFAPLAERRGVALQFRSARESLPAAFDAEELEKVLLNLVSNAFKFTEPGGSVEVSVSVDGAYAVVVVRDSGAGISPGQLPRVFERFYQADASVTRPYEGTGIGLALVKELVELHGGEVTAESVVGEGSTFTVCLPLGEGAPVVPVAQVEGDRTSRQRVITLESDGEVAALVIDDVDERVQSSPIDHATDRTTVLVVDDNTDVRAYVRSVLESAYRVVEEDDGESALEVIRSELPDLIVADVMMPKMDGLSLARALKGDPMTDAIPLVLLTARAAPEDQVVGLETGADAYLLKPFDPDVLAACVANLLAKRQRLRERFRSGDALAPRSDAAPSLPSAIERRLRSIVEKRLTDSALNPEALAAAAGLSYQQMYRALREEMATTPSRFIRGVRVECAAELLLQGVGSVTEVAYSVGFESLSYFSRAFHERFGVAPSTYLTAEHTSSPRA